MPANLPHEHHVVRYVSYQRTRRDENDRVVGILSEAFRLRPDEAGLSVTWVEHFPGEWNEALQAAVAAIRRTTNVGKIGQRTSARRVLSPGGLLRRSTRLADPEDTVFGSSMRQRTAIPGTRKFVSYLARMSCY